MSSTLRTLLLWMVIFVVVILLWNTFQVGKTTQHELTYSEFNEQFNKGQIAKITLRDQSITGVFKEGGRTPRTPSSRSSCRSGRTPSSPTS